MDPTQPDGPRGASPAARRTAIGAAVLAILGPAEGMRQVAYRDPPGILTVCQGHTNLGGGAPIDPHHVYTIAECKKFTYHDIDHAIGIVEGCTSGAPDPVVVAFSDAVYNLGQKIACDRSKSTAARMLFAHNWAGACDELPRWDKAVVLGISISLPGLSHRREIEQTICLKGAVSSPKA